MTTAGHLPHIDEHSIAVGADPSATWEALLRTVEASVSSPVSGRLAGLLGCADVKASGPRPLAAGASLPGFHIDVAAPRQELALAGRHRFSEYALIFRLDDEGEGGTVLRAETRAVFPGLKGRTYRTLVIGTRGHVLVTRRILGAAKRRAERR